MDFKQHLLKYLDTKFIDNLLDSMDKKRTNSLILNTHKISNEKFEKMFPKLVKNPIIADAYYFDKNDYDFGKSFYFDNGLFYIMDSASMMISFLLPITDGEYVLDMCAAPGGKTISLALKNPTLNILANDISYKRALILSSNIEKLGLENVIISSTTIDILERYYKNTFDKIILDAPCSGSSMFRKNEEMKNDWTYNKVLSCQASQKTLLEQACTMLKPGGVISYSTCSFSYEENEEVIIDFLQKHPEFSTIKILDNKSFYRDINLFDSIHLFPNLFNGEGQFVCLLKKDGNVSQKTKEISSISNTTYESYKTFKHLERIKDNLYAYNSDLNTDHLTIIRKGLCIFDYRGKIEIPSFHYAHYLNSSLSLPLSEIEAKNYLHGDQLTKKIITNSEYCVVSYDSVNLGFVHIVENKLKNLYPKGLRH